jgi:predicted dithiol-disulfide oxidoreductase (DUF899 family)
MPFPGESAEYRAARDRLLEREIELRRATEALAQARRELPPGGRIPEDYVFEGRERGVRMSELFAPGRDSLVIYSFMFPATRPTTAPGPPPARPLNSPLHEGPCPSCTALLDQLDGAAPHLAQHLTFVAGERGWRHLALLSSRGNSYNRAETPDGEQRPMLNVLHRDQGTIRHFWGSELFYAPAEPGEDPRHVGTLEPLWNMLDLTPEGRPDWYEQFQY